MSEELVRYALEETRQSMLRGISSLIKNQQSINLIMFLIDEQGHVLHLMWTDRSRLDAAVNVIRTAVQETGAVAALYVDEFNSDTDNNGYRVCCMHWCYPADCISESDFFTRDPEDGEIHEIEEYETDNVPDLLIDWLDQTLLETRTPKPGGNEPSRSTL